MFSVHLVAMASVAPDELTLLLNEVGFPSSGAQTQNVTVNCILGKIMYLSFKIMCTGTTNVHIQAISRVIFYEICVHRIKVRSTVYCP